MAAWLIVPEPGIAAPKTAGTNQERTPMNNIHHPRSTRPSAPYATPPGAEERTFELTVDSIYELWLVTTFTAWFGEEFWATSPLPSAALNDFTASTACHCERSFHAS